jgi:hypothetical protein
LMTEAAETSETSCSTEREPKMTPIRSFGEGIGKLKIDNSKCKDN